MFKQGLLLLTYNKDVVCFMDQGSDPICKALDTPSRRASADSSVPSHDPYIPRTNPVYYNCTNDETCEPIKLFSLIQITDPKLKLKSCFILASIKSECEEIRFNHFKNVDKLEFLIKNIANKTFYLVDCLVYEDYSRVCHAKDNPQHHVSLSDVGTLVRPNEKRVLSQDEFLCEQSDSGHIDCDLDPFVPFDDGLRLKETSKIEGDILLKTGSFAVLLKKTCVDSWCGYSGNIAPTRRANSDWFPRYDPPGGKVFRCYYAKRQQICKLLYDPHTYRTYNNDRVSLRLA